MTAIFLTTDAGRRIGQRLGLRGAFGGDGPSREDRDFLLRACGGDRREVARRLAAERARFPDMSEAQIHRRAIRTLMNDPGRSPIGDQTGEERA